HTRSKRDWSSDVCSSDLLLEVINILIILFIIGLIFGSFFNVVGLRIPKRESRIYPNSHCPNCQSFLSWKDNIRVISYILLKGKCRYCQVPMSKIYPITEFSVGLFFMFAAYEIETNDLVISLALISLLTLATITDNHYFNIPNKLLSFFMGIFIIIIVLHPLDTWYDSLLGFLISY